MLATIPTTATATLTRTLTASSARAHNVTQTANWSSNTISSFNGQILGFEGSLDFDGVELFRHAHVAFERGFIHGLVGPNGSGKTSLVRALPHLPSFPERGSFCCEYIAADVEDDTTSFKRDCSARDYCLSRIQKRVQEIEQEIVRMEEQLETESSDVFIEEISNRLGELYELKEDIELQASTQLEQLFHQLNFGEDYPNQPYDQLSSGWKFKCQLIAALLTQPDCLIIDEPSFLDTAATAWLVDQMKHLAHSHNTSKNAMIILISHKEALLDEVCDRILYLNPVSKNLTMYNCSFREFQAAHADRVAHAKKAKELGAEARDDAKESLQQLRQQLHKREHNFRATTFKDHDKRWIKGKNKEAKQNADHSAASKLKRLKKKADELAEQEEELRETKACPLKLEGAAPSDGVLVEFNDVDFQFEGARDMLLEYVDVQIKSKDRILLQGENGQGKTTLSKLILGELEPTHGNIRRNLPVVAHFHQEALRELMNCYGKTNVIDFLMTKNPKFTMVQARTYAGRFGLKGNIALRPIRTLSAGQRVRLWLAREFLGTIKPSMLVLDEVTENLDKETTDSLLQALEEFPAAIVAISHDDYFAEKFHETQLWIVGNGRVRVEYK
jgi:ATPase subunit of ABC transporter with duplicated ATPase domains